VTWGFESWRLLTASGAQGLRGRRLGAGLERGELLACHGRRGSASRAWLGTLLAWGGCRGSRPVGVGACLGAGWAARCPCAGASVVGSRASRARGGRVEAVVARAWGSTQSREGIAARAGT
jgi:hypothetical protein